MNDEKEMALSENEENVIQIEMSEGEENLFEAELGVTNYHLPIICIFFYFLQFDDNKTTSLYSRKNPFKEMGNDTIQSGQIMLLSHAKLNPFT